MIHVMTKARLPMALLALIALAFSCLGMPARQAAYSENDAARLAPTKIPRGAQYRAIEVGLPDDAIVALADLKFDNVKRSDPSKEDTEATCTGAINRFIVGSDKERTISFECLIIPGAFFTNPGMAKIAFSEALWSMINAREAKNCLSVYERNKDGSVKILRLDPNGQDLIPAYEWLESTKDRKEDRPALAVMVLMDKDAPEQVRRLAYRTVAFSDLSFKSRFEIIKKAIDVAPIRDDRNYIEYGTSMLYFMALANVLSPDQHASIIRYYLESFAATKDVLDANFWLCALSSYLSQSDPEDYAALRTEIADTIKKHVATPPPDPHSMDLFYYKSAVENILAKVEPENAPPAPEESPRSAPGHRQPVILRAL